MIKGFAMVMVMIFGMASLTFLSSFPSVLIYVPLTYAAESNCINYDIYTNTINVRCNANLSEIDQVVNDKSVLERDLNGVWILNANIKVNPQAKLSINQSDTSWLKITNKIFQEQEPNFISISGTANIDGVKITSWNPFSNDVIRQVVNGSIPRPYILIDRGNLNISNSELSFLGLALNASKSGLSYQYGGNGSQIVNNTFRNMWDGFHSDFSGFLTIKNNKYYDNIRSGISIFQSSNSNVYDNIVKSNHIGIWIAENSSQNSVNNNTLTNNTFGFYFADNHPKNNLFENNKLYNVPYPVRLDGINNIGRNNRIYNDN